MMVEHIEPSAPATQESYSVFGTFHVHKFLFVASLFGLAVCLITAPLFQVFGAGFGVLSLFRFVLLVAAFVLILVGNRRNIPQLYFPVLALITISLIFAAYIIIDSYFHVSNEIFIFSRNVKFSPKPNFSHESALIAVEYFDHSFIIHLTFGSIVLLFYALNLILTDYFFMIETAEK